MIHPVLVVATFWRVTAQLEARPLTEGCHLRQASRCINIRQRAVGWGDSAFVWQVGAVIISGTTFIDRPFRELACYCRLHR